MLKQKPERITYAQEKLITLIEERKLRRWCQDNGLTHSAIYRLALGEQVATYRIMASMCHLIAPIEWLFFTDEKLPYEPVLLPQWSYKNPSKYVLSHKYDYRTIAKKYNLETITAYNIFIAHRACPSPAFIKAACKETNPIEFFTDGEKEIKSLKEFIPDRGDIVSVDGKLIFVLTKQKTNEKHKCFSGCMIITNTKEGIELKDTISKGYICPFYIMSFNILPTEQRTLIEKTSEEISKKVMKKVVESFNLD